MSDTPCDWVKYTNSFSVPLDIADGHTCSTALKQVSNSPELTLSACALTLAGRMLIGNSLILENPKVDENGAPTGVMQFKVDSTGAWLNNSTFVLQSDNGGKLMLHPDYGLVAGTSKLFDTNGTQVLPSFIDEDGKIVLDDDGFPENANFYIDSRDGNAYFRGKVVATSGEFNGDVYANNFYFDNGDSVRTLINKKGEVDFSNMTRIDLGGIVIDGETKNINFTDAGSITWGNNGPVRYQFSTSLSGPWHNIMESTDKYRRDSLDGGVTWGNPYQFIGKDGANGSDANVPQWVKDMPATYIDDQWVISPNIYGGKITSETTINVGTDATIGSCLYLTSDENISRSIIFSDNASISTIAGSEELKISAFGNITFETGGMLNLSGVGGIIWGNNAPVARFG